MFIPLKDNNPLDHIKRPYVNWSLIAANIFIFALFQGAAFGFFASPDVSYGIIPDALFAAAGSSQSFDNITAKIPAEFTLLTYMFLHGGWMHLGGNMMFLWVFGDNIEDAVGHIKYLIFYLSCGVLAALTHVIAFPQSQSPLVGASGAVAGVMGAYFLLHPRVRVWVLVWRIPLPLPAILAIGAWIAMQFMNVFFASQENIAWWAHIGGFASGVVLIIFMRRKGTKLLDMS